MWSQIPSREQEMQICMGFYIYEPFMKKHYDEMPRKDMTKMPYQINKPNYEYSV